MGLFDKLGKKNNDGKDKKTTDTAATVSPKTETAGTEAALFADGTDPFASAPPAAPFAPDTAADGNVVVADNAAAGGNVVFADNAPPTNDNEIIEIESELSEEVAGEFGGGGSINSFADIAKPPNPMFRILFTFLAIITAAGLGVAGTAFYFYNTYKGALVNVAWKAVYTAAVSVNHLLQFPDYFTVEDIYIRDKQGEYDVLIFASLQYDPLEYTPEIFHIIINKDDNTATVMDDTEFDDELYQYLTESSDPTERLQAGVIKQAYEELQLSLNEIKSGRNNWIHASDAYCNLQLVLQGNNWRALLKEQADAAEAAKNSVFSAAANRDGGGGH